MKVRFEWSAEDVMGVLLVGSICACVVAAVWSIIKPSFSMADVEMQKSIATQVIKCNGIGGRAEITGKDFPICIVREKQ